MNLGQPHLPVPFGQPSQPQQWYQHQPHLPQQLQSPTQHQVLVAQGRPQLPVPSAQASQPQQWYQPQPHLPQQLQPHSLSQVLPQGRPHLFGPPVQPHLMPLVRTTQQYVVSQSPSYVAAGGPAYQQGSAPVTGPRPTGEHDIFLSGTPVTPFAVIFTGEPVERVTRMVTAFAPTLAHLVSTIHQRGTGTAMRCELHCKQTDLGQAVSIIQALKDKGVKGVAAYQPRTQSGPSDLSTTAGRGLDAQILQTGVCRNFHYGVACTHNPCKFKCYADAAALSQHHSLPP